jgi:heptosyltransferase-2
MEGPFIMTMARVEQQGVRILVRGTNWIGDAVMSTPALRHLRERFPEAEIVLLATPLTEDLFTDCPWIDHFLPYRRREEGWRAFVRMVQHLRRDRFDIAILFQNAIEAALLTWLAGIPQRVGYQAEGRGRLLTKQLRRGPQHRDRHQIYDYLDLVDAGEAILKGDRPSEGTLGSSPMLLPELNVGEGARAQATSQLLPLGITDGGGPRIALNVGATNSRAKCWPTNHYAALADWLVKTFGATILLTGGPSERAAAAAVMAEMGHVKHAFNLAGETSLPVLLGILETCALIISNDTGPAHIAAALGRPVLTLFGPTNEWETAPRGKWATLLRAEDIACARCMHRDCPIDHRCMTQLTVEMVQERVTILLAETGLPASAFGEAP